MASTAWSISSTKLLKESPAPSIWRAFMRSDSDLAWSRSLDCTPDRNAAFSASVPRAPWPLTWFQVAVMISFWRSRNLVLLVGLAAAAAPAAAILLRLRVVALEGLRPR